MALKPTRVVLPNGITVIAKANHTSPTVSLLVGVRTGAYADPPGKDGTAALCARVLDRGTSKRTAEVIADDLDGRGASLSVVAGRHQMALAATCLAEDFRAGAGAGRRRGAPSRFSGKRDHDPPRAADHVDSAGRGQPRDDGRGCVCEGALWRSSLRAKGARHDPGTRVDPAPGSRPVPSERVRPADHDRGGGRRRRRGVRARRASRSCSATGRRLRQGYGGTRRPSIKVPDPADAARAPPRARADDEQGAGRRGLRLPRRQAIRSGLHRDVGDEQRPRPVRDRRAARRQHSRAPGDGVLRVQLARRDVRSRPVLDSRRRGGRQRREDDRLDRRRSWTSCSSKGFTRAGDRRVEELHDRLDCRASSRPTRRSRRFCSTSRRSASAWTTTSGCRA